MRNVLLLRQVPHVSNTLYGSVRTLSAPVFGQRRWRLGLWSNPLNDKTPLSPVWAELRFSRDVGSALQASVGDLDRCRGTESGHLHGIASRHQSRPMEPVVLMP